VLQRRTRQSAKLDQPLVGRSGGTDACVQGTALEHPATLNPHSLKVVVLYFTFESAALAANLLRFVPSTYSGNIDLYASSFSMNFSLNLAF